MLYFADLKSEENRVTSCVSDVASNFERKSFDLNMFLLRRESMRL